MLMVDSDSSNAGARILDLGCGTKPYRLANIVMDINPIIKELPDNVSKIIYDLNNIPYPFEDCSIDEIHCYQLLEHLRVHTLDFFRECYRVLKPNGTLHVHLPNAFFITARLRFFFGRYVDDTSFHPFHVKLLKPSYVRQHLRYLGFSATLEPSTRSRWARLLQKLSADLFCRGIYVVARKRP